MVHNYLQEQYILKNLRIQSEQIEFEILAAGI